MFAHSSLVGLHDMGITPSLLSIDVKNAHMLNKKANITKNQDYVYGIWQYKRRIIKRDLWQVKLLENS